MLTFEDIYKIRLLSHFFQILSYFQGNKTFCRILPLPRHTGRFGAMSGKIRVSPPPPFPSSSTIFISQNLTYPEPKKHRKSNSAFHTIWSTPNCNLEVQVPQLCSTQMPMKHNLYHRYVFVTDTYLQVTIKIRSSASVATRKSHE